MVAEIDSVGGFPFSGRLPSIAPVSLRSDSFAFATSSEPHASHAQPRLDAGTFRFPGSHPAA
jgi:hypothetical protein